ncbi:MAG: sialate O-acetylesterase [Bryobacteraceae bacterium]|nr:sialate O-acetylesterase [Bryobacteraceae bacterium]
MRRRSILAGASALWAADGPKDLRIFLLCGQSNMAGRGEIEEQDRRSLERVWSMNKANEWALATDPLHYDKPAIAGVGLGRTFARVLTTADPAAKLGLVPCAMGGSALHEWAPGAPLYQNAVKRARIALGSGRLAGLLWHQGESDANDEQRAETYLERFSVTLAALRKELGVMPVVVGQLGEFLREETSPFADTVNHQLARVPLEIRRAAFVSSAGLGHRGDEIHFDAAGFRELGRRYAHAYLGLDASWRMGEKA